MHANWRNPASPPGALYTLRPAAAAPAPAARSPAAVQLAGAAVVAAAVAGAALATRASSSSGAGRTAGRAALAAGAGAALPGAALASAPPPPTRVATAHQPPSLGVSVPGARLSNGMTWSPDGATLFWVDSGLNRIEAFDFDGASGAVSNRRTAVTVPPLGAGVHGAAGGIPDGCTIDAAGKLWVALAESGTVVQYDPETGAQAAAVALPARRVTACTFGGEGLGELFVTMRQEAGAGGCREAGAVFRVRVPGVRGLHAAYEYAG